MSKNYEELKDNRLKGSKGRIRIDFFGGLPTTGSRAKIVYTATDVNAGKIINHEVAFEKVGSIFLGDELVGGRLVSEINMPSHRIVFDAENANSHPVSLDKLSSYHQFQDLDVYDLFSSSGIKFGRRGRFEMALISSCKVYPKNRNFKIEDAFVIIPCTEIFRCYYATSSNMAQELIRETVRPKDTRFFCGATHKESEEKFYLHPNVKMRHVDMKRLLPSLYYEDESSISYAAQQVKRMHESFIAQRQANTRKSSYYPLRIGIGFPFNNAGVSIDALLVKAGIKASNGKNIYILKRIVASDYPLPENMKDIEFFEKSAQGDEQADNLQEVGFNHKKPKDKVDGAENVDSSTDVRPDGELKTETVIRDNALCLLDEEKYPFVQSEKPISKYKAKAVDSKDSTNEHSSDEPTREQASEGNRPIVNENQSKSSQVRSISPLDDFEVLVKTLNGMDSVVAGKVIAPSFLSAGYAEFPSRVLPFDENSNSWDKIWFGKEDYSASNIGHRPRRVAVGTLSVEGGCSFYFMEIEKRSFIQNARKPRKISNDTSESFKMFVYFSRSVLIDEDIHKKIISDISSAEGKASHFRDESESDYNGIEFHYFSHKTKAGLSLASNLASRLVKLAKITNQEIGLTSEYSSEVSKIELG